MATRVEVRCIGTKHVGLGHPVLRQAKESGIALDVAFDVVRWARQGGGSWSSWLRGLQLVENRAPMISDVVE